MSKMKTIIAIAGAVILSAAGAGGAVWWFMPKPAAAGTEKKAAQKPKEAKPVKYVTLDKVIVMLRRGPNETESHYLSTDLVLATDPVGEAPGDRDDGVAGCLGHDAIFAGRRGGVKRGCWRLRRWQIC